jgi:hypothetical protein
MMPNSSPNRNAKSLCNPQVCQPFSAKNHPLDSTKTQYRFYSPVSNIGDIWSLEEGSDEGSIVLDIGEVGLNALLQQFV